MIKNELEKNGFYTYNSDVVYWKVFENCSSFTVEPCIDKPAVSSQKRQNSRQLLFLAKKKLLKKMASNNLSKPIRFSSATFQELPAPDLLINIWSKFLIGVNIYHALHVINIQNGAKLH